MARSAEVILDQELEPVASRPYMTCRGRNCPQRGYPYYFPITTLRRLPEYRKAADDPARA
jgi:hypothetical protein